MVIEQNVTPTTTTTSAPVVSNRSARTTTTTASRPHSKRTSSRKKSIKQKEIDTVLVVNPNSSSGLTGKGWNDLYSQIKEALGTTSVEVALTKKAGDGTTLTRQFLKQGFKKVVAIGGDGT